MQTLLDPLKDQSLPQNLLGSKVGLQEQKVKGSNKLFKGSMWILVSLL
jgi:hypothetical protein